MVLLIVDQFFGLCLRACVVLIIITLFNNFSFQTRLVNNQPYDETLSVHDDEEIASTFTPSPRPAKSRGGRSQLTGIVVKLKVCLGFFVQEIKRNFSS